MQIQQLTYLINPLFTAPAIDTDLLWGLSAFFVSLALLYFVSVFFFRNRISSKSLRSTQRKMELSPMISEFLFYEEDADKDEKSQYIGLKIKIRDLLKDDFNKKILVEILLDLRKDVSGDTQNRLFKLYQDLGLEQDAFKKLESWRWEVVSKGILELTLMQVEDAYGFIIKFINDRRVTIRKQSEIATVTLKTGGIGYFLDTTQYKISEWQQLKLLDVLRNKEGFEPPRFKAWLTSTNKHVVLFSLRLIQYYNQNDANASVIELIKHKDPQVRQQAINCIQEFHVTSALPILKGVFWTSSVDIKITILAAIAELGCNGDIEFLESVLLNEDKFSVKSKAVGAINSIVPESIMPTKGIDDIKDYQLPDEARESNRPSIQNQNLTKKNRPMANQKKSDKALRNIIIDIEEVKPVPCDGKQDLNNSDFDISEIHFLPIVVGDKTDSASGEDPSTEDAKISARDLHGIEVHSIEISSESIDEELEALVAEIEELVFLPLVTDDSVHGDGEGSFDADKKEPGHELENLKDIEGYFLSDFEVSFERKNKLPISQEGENIRFNLEDEPIVNLSPPQAEEVISGLVADNELREIPCDYESVPYSFDEEVIKEFIPEPVYYNEHEAYMMGLLDDLEELGDQREIPLLEELRAEESKSFIKDRIASMIEKFARQRISKKTKSSLHNEAAELPVFSVFADLFNTIDSEAKLILLDEVIHVGDEKEIQFLDGLLQDSDKKIRDKAQLVLKQLIAKISHENPLATYSKGVSAIVAEQLKDDENLSEEILDGLLYEMDLAPAKNPEIFNIDFDLCEGLDKNGDKNLWDLPVTATEVSPHQIGGSFFSQLWNFKLFF